MSKVIVDISMSLDGYVTGPNDGPGNGLGDGGESLHYWVFGRRWTYADYGPDDAPTGVDAQVLDETFSAAGAVIVGRGMFDAAGGWGDKNPFPMPCFMLTTRADELRERAPSFEYAADVHDALARARAAAGEKDVLIGGGADVIQQFLEAGLVDELSLHLAPVVLGGGKPLFVDGQHVELSQTKQLASPFTTHLRYDVIR